MKIKHQKIDWFEFIIEILFLIFAVILIIQLILKIIGNSPTDPQLTYIIFSVALTYLVNTNHKFNYKFGRIEEKLSSIETKLTKIESKI